MSNLQTPNLYRNLNKVALAFSKPTQYLHGFSITPTHSPHQTSATMTPPQDRLPPSLTAYAIATVILVFVGGYFVGQGISLGVFSRSASASASPGRKKKESWPNSYDVKVHADSSDEESLSESEDLDEDEDEDEEGEQGELNPFTGSSEECKLVLVVRTDLGMGKGPSRPPPFLPSYLPGNPTSLPRPSPSPP